MYIELLTRCRRRINSYGIRLGHCTFDSAELNPFRRQPSGADPDGRNLEVHYDLCDISRAWVRNHREAACRSTRLRILPEPACFCPSAPYSRAGRQTSAVTRVSAAAIRPSACELLPSYI
ncbi:Mu transposase C-terminal domain-containing protein [Streptomyces sp. NPDC048411]|uniref:Mu transposase C-terminal domain-containing protein n=1 Tax=Streptomyces sp. NPDC048411 TaxID=3157206 RepID=UPI003454114B